MKLPPLSPHPIRHCLGHLYPFAGNDLWQWHVRQLVDRLPLFNGRVLLSIVTDRTTVRLERVIDLVNDLVPDYRNSRMESTFFKNDPLTGERSTFLCGLNKLSSEMANPNALLFYWHSKGVSIRPGDPRHHYEAVRRWADSMWRTNCDCFPLVQEQLRTAAVTGSHRQPWPKSDCTHFSGAYFWVRLAALAGRKWANLDADRWCVEKWPGQMFDTADTACLFDDRRDDITAPGCLYRDSTWDWLSHDLYSFLATHSTNRSELSMLTPRP